MSRIMAIPTLFVPLLLLAQAPDPESVASLIRKLGSPTFQERVAATKALKERSEAEPALREALRSNDPEVRRRVAEILDFFDRRPVRELDDAVKEGRVDRAIEILGHWPASKYEDEAWRAIRDLARRLGDLHRKDASEKIKLSDEQALLPGGLPVGARPAPGGAKHKFLVERWGDQVPLFLLAKRVAEDTTVDLERSYFFRAGEVDIRQPRQKGGRPQILSEVGSVFVVTGSVRMVTFNPQVIFAGGRVEFSGEGVRTLIVSCADVNLKGHFGASLVIARGAVTCTGSIADSQIISGKSITMTQNPKNCIISENDSTPLGFIRWSDAPKDKAAPKAK